MREVKIRNYILVIPDEEIKEEPKATIKQISYIHALVKDLGWSDKKYREYLYKHFLKVKSSELSKRDASRLIENLKYIKEHELNTFETEFPEILPDFGCEI